MGLITAIKAFQDEYGYLPHADIGTFLDEPTQARLLRTLHGQDLTENPRGIVFFEQRVAEKRKRGWKTDEHYSSGVSPETGAFLDFWGRPYRIQLQPKAAGAIRPPYTDEDEARSPAIAWTLGADGVQGSPGKENILEGSDDIVSWR